MLNASTRKKPSETAKMKVKNKAIKIAALLLLVMCAAPAYAQITTGQISYKNLFQQGSERLHEKGFNDVQETLKIIGAGGEQIEAGEVTAHLKKNLPAIGADEPLRLYVFVRENMITKGADHERLQKVITPLLRFYWLEGKVFPILYKSEQPVIMFTYPKGLIFSTRALALLSDDEIAALAAHELSHLILRDEFKVAEESGNKEVLRLIELFCDAAGAAIIEARGKDPGKLISGLSKLQQVLEVEYDQIERAGQHPTIKTRDRLNKELIRRFKLSTEPSSGKVSARRN